MTCIIAIEDGRRCWIAADSFGGGDDWCDLCAASKIQPFGPGLAAFAGTLELSQWMQTQKLSNLRKRESVQTWLVRECNKLRERAQKAGLDIDPKSETSNVMLVAIRGEAWFIQPDFTIHRSAHGYAAFGSGMAYALGSLATTDHMEPAQRINAAMKAAERHCPSVRSPFDITATRAA